MRRCIPSRESGPGELRRFSAHRRGLRALLSAGLLAGLLGTTPAAGAAENPGLTMQEARPYVVGYWQTGGRGLKEAAEQALLGGDDAIRKFLDEAEGIQHSDNRVETARLAMTGGPRVREAAVAALQKAPAELQDFLLDGYVEPLDTDHKVEIARLVQLGGPRVRQAGEAALKGTYADREQFLAKEQYTAQQTDNRVAVAQLTNTGGPNVQAAARAALQGTPEDIVEFLEVGQLTARNRDQEHATIAELTAQAQAAGKQAEDATKLAEEASKKAVQASSLAKQAAKKAAEETQAAKNDAKKASVKAAQAADAARAAAQAAQEAIGSANAANRAARRAALAAAQTASAAAAAADAANTAYNAAVAAAGDASKAEDARKAAAGARAASLFATQSAVAAESAGRASAAAAVASDAAIGASANALAAADAADEASDYADAAGAHSAEARQAAIEARRHANAASAAANRSAGFARRAANAAYGARDDANSAAAHANKAADYAEDAANHAGDAANYTAQAQKNADAAKNAADTAASAVAKAKEVAGLAREVEAGDLETRTQAAIERATSLKAAGEARISASASLQVQALSLNDTATSLATEASRPDADVKATAAKGRQLAMQAMKLLGPWHQDAAARALSGTDQDVLDYLRTRWKEANQSDVRQRVLDLSTTSPHPSVRNAATEALKGTPEQIEAFLNEGRFTAGYTEMRVDVARFTNTGGPHLKESAQNALANGSGKALATFLQTGQYAARTADERVAAAQLTNIGGAEAKAAARIALAGTPESLHEFITTGQHTARLKDDLATNHTDQINRLLAEGDIIVAKAQQNRWIAAEAAAKAAQATADAQKAAQQAADSARQAQTAANDAKTSADKAANSAADAQRSAATARSAADRANQDASDAENSAAQAEFSASYARQSAKKANDSAEQARQSALAAGKSRDEANAMAKDAWTAVRTLVEKEIAEALRQAEEERKQQEEAKPKRICRPFASRESMIPILACAADPEHSTIEVGQNDPFLTAAVWELSGLNDIKACIQDPGTVDCIVAGISSLPWGRAKVLLKIDDGVEALKHMRATRRAVECLTSNAQKHSFPAGTRVLTDAGATVPIEEIRVGDRVTATDPTTGETGPRTVTRTIRTPDDRSFTDVTLTDGSSITSTDGHAYWVENRKRWIDARDLRVGDALRTPVGSVVQIGKISQWVGLQPAYDLTIEDLHTYYVSTGTADVLVHNTDGNGSCPIWVARELDQLRGDHITTGVLRDSRGFAFSEMDGKISSGVDGLSETIDKWLKDNKYPMAPNQDGPYSSTHAETKWAYLMRENDIKNGIVVINKNGGVCTGYDSCSVVVEHILPEGWTMDVYYPEAKKSTTLTGKGPKK